MERDPGSILDQQSIAKLKTEHDLNYNDELKLYNEGVMELRAIHLKLPWQQLQKLFYDINSLIWEQESLIRKGDLDGDMEAAGKAAIGNRDLNRIRVGLGNLVNTLCNNRFITTKVNHGSED